MTLTSRFSPDAWEQGREEDEEIVPPGWGTSLRGDRGGGGGSPNQGNAEQSNGSNQAQNTPSQGQHEQGSSEGGQRGSRQPSPPTNRR